LGTPTPLSYRSAPLFSTLPVDQGLDVIAIQLGEADGEPSLPETAA
jgi:hypothetical protein